MKEVYSVFQLAHVGTDDCSHGGFVNTYATPEDAYKCMEHLALFSSNEHYTFKLRTSLPDFLHKIKYGREVEVWEVCPGEPSVSADISYKVGKMRIEEDFDEHLVHINYI